MRVLIVFAHPEGKSFNGKLFRLSVETLKAQGHEVEVSDLSDMAFNPVCGPTDFQIRKDESYLNVQEEQKHASQNLSFSADVAKEQEKLMAADLLIMHFPLWWFSMPAIMKGWVDRVFAYGFAYGGGRWYDNGVFKGKRACLTVSAGGRASAYEPDGLQGDISNILFPIHHGILRFCGYDVLPPFLVFGDQTDNGSRVEAAYAEHLSNLQTAEPLPFPPLSAYDDTLRLKK